MVGWHHRLNGHEFGQTLGVGDGQGGLACCCSWGCKELDTNERLNMAAYSSTLAWKISWMEEPGGLQSMGSLRVGHD